jgi:thiol-disulfide isomerase/thioredoxin
MYRQCLKTALVLTVFCFNSSLIAAEVGNAMPACKLTPLGETTSEDLQKYKGQVVYVDFWASWCVPCAHSFPFLNEIHQQLKDKGLQIIAINMDENIEDAQAFLEKVPAKFTIMTDATTQCAKDFDVKAMPSSYLVDRKGIIHKVHLGFRSDDTKELRAVVENLLAQK